MRLITNVGEGDYKNIPLSNVCKSRHLNIGEDNRGGDQGRSILARRDSVRRGMDSMSTAGTGESWTGNGRIIDGV